MQRGDSVGCCALLSETGGEFVPADWTDENSIDSIANAIEGYLRAGWDGARRGGDGDDDDDDSLRAIGARARRRAVGWDLLASGREIAKILTRAVRGESFAQSRWTLPDATEQKRLAPLWRAASIAVWCDGAWRMIRSTTAAAAAAANRDRGFDRTTTTTLGRVFGNDERPVLPAGTYVIVTAHNPMGARADPAANDSAARALAASVRDMRPSPAAVLPTLSIDPGEGGFDAWNEPEWRRCCPRRIPARREPR